MYQVAYADFYSLSRQDAVWYTFDNDAQWVASVYKNNRSIEIMRCGFMRLWLPDEHDGTLIRYTDQLIENGITNDEELEMAGRGEYPLDWQNNPWFELYDPIANEWLDIITHDVNDAIRLAKEVMENE